MHQQYKQPLPPLELEAEPLQQEEQRRAKAVIIIKKAERQKAELARYDARFWLQEWLPAVAKLLAIVTIPTMAIWLAWKIITVAIPAIFYGLATMIGAMFAAMAAGVAVAAYWFGIGIAVLFGAWLLICLLKEVFQSLREQRTTISDTAPAHKDAPKQNIVINISTDGININQA